MKTKIKVSSRAVSNISYDDESKVLTITMAYGPPKNHNEVLKYANVPGYVFQDFMNAESKGQYYNFYVRDNYPLVN